MAIDTRPNLAVTIGPLATAAEPLAVREAIAWVASLGYRGAQLNAADPATRPRDLGASARRDLAATLGRHELACAGIDLFIPAAHFMDPAQQSRAFDAVIAAIGLAADLGRAPVTAPLPDEIVGGADSGIRQEIAAEADRLGVLLLLSPRIDAPREAGATPAPTAVAAEATSEASIAPPFGAFIDCAAVLAAQGRPEATVASLSAALGERMAAVRVVDLLRSGLRGPILEPRESRLDALALRLAIELSPASRLDRPVAVVDARQWSDVRTGIASSLLRWRALLD